MNLLRKLQVLLPLVGLLAVSGPVRAQAEVPAGTRFLVELRDDLKGPRVKEGKKFDARTLEALRLDDGSVVEAGAKLKGRVSYARDNEMILRFETIDTRRGKMPIVATVTRVVGEKYVKDRTSNEGEIKSSGSRGRNAAIGAAIGGGIGAAIGASRSGGSGAAIGAGTGAAAGALVGAASGGHDLELQKGTRLELTLDRPLVVARRR